MAFASFVHDPEISDSVRLKKMTKPDAVTSTNTQVGKKVYSL